MLCGLNVCGQRRLEHFNAVDFDDLGADTAASPRSSGDDDEYWKITPQEPGSFYIANFSAHKTSLVYHTEENLDSNCLHIAVTLRTDIFDRGRISAAHEPYVYDWRLKDIVDEAVARFLSERQPRMPNLTDVILAPRDACTRGPNRHQSMSTTRS